MSMTASVMTALVPRLLTSLCLVSLVAATVPCPSTLDSDLAILTHNDLYGNSSDRQASVIVVSKRQTHSAAESSCAALSEPLWSHEQQEAGFLNYAEYANKKYGKDYYWIAGSSRSKCNAVDTQGRTLQLPCDTNLPALCLNSAALSSVQSTDTSSKWQTSVTTGNASFTGYRDKHSFRFQGIKYATYPSRFTHSAYLPPSGSNIPALSYGPQCTQTGCGSGPAPCSEDCLYLNIWTPTLPGKNNSKAKKKAVLVWIHGGGFVSGAGSDTAFDGGAMASRGDVVLVTINYRLGNFGFLALEGTPLTGNYGLRDQSNALDWIRAHIGAFGGDEDRITVFGQSAGAASVRALLASIEARSKFAGAIMQSTPQGISGASAYSEYLSIGEATNQTESILTETGCASKTNSSILSCLQAINPLNLTSGTVASYPVIDNLFLTTSLRLGSTADKLNISLLSGNTHDDGTIFSRFPSSTNLSAVLEEQNLPVSPVVNTSLFPLPTTPNTTLAIFKVTSRVATDATFRCLGESTVSSGAKNGVFRTTYAYELDRTYQLLNYSPNPPTCEAPLTAARPFGDPDLPYWKCHSGDLYYVFGTLVREGGRIRDDNDIRFNQYIVDTWASFARTGNPTPDAKFLQARGFTNTTAFVKAAGNWAPVERAKEGRELMVLATNPGTEGWREVQQCEALGLGLDYYNV